GRHSMPDTAIKCPQCGSERLYKDGFRYLNNNTSIQRWLCRDCGYRFSEHQALQKSLRGSINTASAIFSTRQVCDCLTEASKNLTEVARQEVAQREGTTPTADVKGKIIEYIWWLQKEGYSQATIRGRAKLLTILAKRGADLYNPESVKASIAKQPWCEGRKANAVDAYTSFLKMTGGKWNPPRYKGIQKIPFVPTETEVDQLIAGCSKRMGTFLQLLKETGIRPGEAWQLTWTDIDTTTKTVRITPEKNSNPRIFSISQKLAAMLETLPRTYGKRVFSTPDMPLDHHRDAFTQQLKRLAYKLENPRIAGITFKTFRHWKGTMEYHRTKDILHVMETLGHKNIKNTLVYVHLAEALFKDQQEYVSKVAKNEKDACALIEAGFEYVCDFNCHKIFRKRKT
ncbi:MAG: tyrosine-type recombinase/integrase, partial [Candidatus Bathyarchaeota archaeon]|nr:tyrosine-type recombinase/integrase [Candidatus Bathyarchaeota archaeon]